MLYSINNFTITNRTSRQLYARDKRRAKIHLQSVIYTDPAYATSILPHLQIPLTASSAGEALSPKQESGENSADIVESKSRISNAEAVAIINFPLLARSRRR